METGNDKMVTQPGWASGNRSTGEVRVSDWIASQAPDEMDSMDAVAGFREREHTADWELDVWAPDPATLFSQAASGMYALSGVHLAASPRVEHRLELEAVDLESLLVAFLSELLYLGEENRVGFDQMDLSVKANSLLAYLEGAPIASQEKEIKAVTYHKMVIRRTERGMEVQIVFDV